MAKEQNISLNPSKISGVCGRLMCCLKNEQENYEYLNKNLPNIGDIVTTGDGLKGEVVGVNVLKQLVNVVVEDKDSKEKKQYDVKDLKFKKTRKDNNVNKNSNQDIDYKELKSLEELEKKEGASKIDD